MSDYQQAAFDDLPLFAARSTDPATSHLAAAEIKAGIGDMQRAMLMEFRFAITANEAALACVQKHSGLAESYRKRAKELSRAGLVRELAPRRCGVTGKIATVYEAIR